MIHTTHERHTRHRNFILKKSNLITLLTTKSLALLAIALSASCTTVKEDAKQFQSAEEALSAYENFCTDISKKKSATPAKIVDIANEWREISDSVASALSRDSVTADHINQYVNLTDSVHSGIARLIDSKKRSLADYLQVVIGTNPTTLNGEQLELVKATHNFFAALDSLLTYEVDANATVEIYNAVLADALDLGLQSKAEVRDFLREEDRAFRTFLLHLPSLGEIPLVTIRDRTSDAINAIIALTDGETPVLSTEEAVILISMRSNRRLMQNAVQCVNDINSGKIKPSNSNQCVAYLWMLLQPWLSFDELSFAAMSDAQMRMMRELAVETPKAIAKLGNPSFPINLDELPALLIKTFVLGAL